MESISKITFKQLEQEKLRFIADLLNQDSEVNQYLSFYNLTDTIAIMQNNQIIGLFQLIKFIEDNLTIHIALVKEHQNKGLGEIILNQIVQEYGFLNQDVEFFLANMDYNNERAIKTLMKAGWNRTDKYDEIMNQEGGEFFIIYEKENPYYHKSITKR